MEMDLLSKLLTTNCWILIAAIFTIGIAITTPTVQDTTTAGFAFEIGVGTWQITVLFVAAIATVIGSITDGGGGSAAGVLALEGARTTKTSWTGGGFIGAILTVLFAITFPEPRDTFLVIATTTMLTSGTIGYTCLTVPGQIELIGTGTLVTGSTLLYIAFDIQVGGLRWR